MLNIAPREKLIQLSKELLIQSSVSTHKEMCNIELQTLIKDYVLLIQYNEKPTTENLVYYDIINMGVELVYLPDGHINIGYDGSAGYIYYKEYTKFYIKKYQYSDNNTFILIDPFQKDFTRSFYFYKYSSISKLYYRKYVHRAYLVPKDKFIRYGGLKHFI